MVEPVICARGLRRVLGHGGAARAVIADVDLDVAAGELVAIVGASGSGKSTLLHLLAGFDRPTAGTVTIGGHRVDRGSESARARFRRRHVGFVFQSFRLVPELSAFENALMPARLAGDVPAGRRRLAELVGRLGIESCARRLPADLSGGEQQRVALARALVMEPQVLLADEPTGNLDAAAGAGVMALLRAAVGDDRAVVMVTHHADHAVAATRLLRMTDGVLAAADA